MRKRTIVILVILVVIVMGGVWAYRLYDERTPDRSNEQPDIVIKAADLIAAFDRDSAAARKMYVDKLLEVTGTVQQVDSTGSVVMSEEGSPSAVTASLDRRHIEDYKKLKPGAIATIKGKCTGYSKSGEDDLLASLGTTVELNFSSVK